MPEAGSTDSVCVRFVLSAAEYRSGVWRLTWQLRSIRVMLFAFGAIFLIGVGLVVAGVRTLGLTCIGVAIVWTVALGIGVVLRPQVLRRRQPDLEGHQVFCFSDQEVMMTGPLGESRVKWAIYEEVLETRDAYLLRLLRRFANIVPKRAFANTGDELRFRELARRHVKVRFLKAGDHDDGRGRTPSSSNP